MSHTLLCVQFRNLLPSEDLLRCARTLWSAAQGTGMDALEARDATLSITKTDSKTAPYEALLSLENGSLESVATGLEPLSTIEAAFTQLTMRTAQPNILETVLRGESGPHSPHRVAT